MAEPSSVLTFDDLIKEVAVKIGCASYGVSGGDAAAIPTDAHDLDLCKRLVNDAIRMFITDAPQPNGWNWLRPVANLIVWGSIGQSGTIVTAVYDSGENQTTITVSTAPFNATMTNPASVNHTLITDGVSFAIVGFVSSSSVIVTGNASAHASSAFQLSGGPPFNPIVSAPFVSPTTTITVTNPAFYPSMELKTIVINGSSFTIASYVSSKVITVTGDAHLLVGEEFAINADGQYTLPLDFSGQYLGHPTFGPGTNRGSVLEWTDESVIRERRANANEETGTPFLIAIRVMSTGSPRRRWEAMCHRRPQETLTIQFPYMLYFQSLTTGTEVPPAPFGHDEAIKAACRAVAEKNVEDQIGMEWNYYRNIALPNSYRVDALSRPKFLGYFSNGNLVPATIQNFRNAMYYRPTVSFNE